MRLFVSLLGLLCTVGCGNTLYDQCASANDAYETCMEDAGLDEEDDTSDCDYLEDGTIEAESSEEEIAAAEDAYACLEAAYDSNDCSTEQGLLDAFEAAMACIVI